MFGGENELSRSLNDLAGNSRFRQTLHRPLSAAKIVVFRSAVVDRIVKPNGRLELSGMPSELASCVEPRKAVGNVIRIVIVPDRFVRGSQLVEKSQCARSPQRLVSSRQNGIRKTSLPLEPQLTCRVKQMDSLAGDR